MITIRLSLEVTNPTMKATSAALRDQIAVLGAIRAKGRSQISGAEGTTLIDIASMLEGLAQDAERQEGVRR